MLPLDCARHKRCCVCVQCVYTYTFVHLCTPFSRGSATRAAAQVGDTMPLVYSEYNSGLYPFFVDNNDTPFAAAFVVRTAALLDKFQVWLPPTHWCSAVRLTRCLHARCLACWVLDGCAPRCCSFMRRCVSSRHCRIGRSVTFLTSCSSTRFLSTMATACSRCRAYPSLRTYTPGVPKPACPPVCLPAWLPCRGHAAPCPL